MKQVENMDNKELFYEIIKILKKGHPSPHQSERLLALRREMQRRSKAYS